MTAASLIVATVVLGVGTFAFRFAGPILGARIDMSPQFKRMMAMAAIVLLAALVGTSAFFDGQEFAGVARPAGIAVGGVLAWRKAPFAVVVLAAAGTAAVLRLLGVP